MLKATYWIGVISAPILLVTAGCSLSQRPFPTARRALPPERLMEIARTLERQGHINQAKVTYLQVLAAQPNYPNAQQSLDALIAAAANNQDSKKSNLNSHRSETLISQSRATNNSKARSKSTVDEPSSSKPSELASSMPTVKHDASEQTVASTPAVALTPAVASTQPAASTQPIESKPETLREVKSQRRENSSPINGVAFQFERVPAPQDPVDDPFPSDNRGSAVVASEPTLAGSLDLSDSDLKETLKPERDSFRRPVIAGSTSTLPPSPDRIGSAERDDIDLAESILESTIPAPSALSGPADSVGQADEEVEEPIVAATAPARERWSGSRDYDRNEEPIVRTQSAPSELTDAADQLVGGPSAPVVAGTEPVLAATEPNIAWATTPASTAAEVVEQDEREIRESIQFEKPVIHRAKMGSSDLEQFLGPFNVGMIQNVKANRERIQPQLATLVADQDASSDDRSRAVFLLGAIGADAIEVVPTLRREMHYDIDEFLRVDLSEAILKIQPEDTDAIQVLVDCLKDSNESVKWVAAFALRNAVSPRTTFIIDSLRESLNTDDLKFRRMVYLTLAEFGPAAAKAIPDLEAALNSPDPATREVAKASLACIAPDRKTSQKSENISHRNQFAANK